MGFIADVQSVILIRVAVLYIVEPGEAIFADAACEAVNRLGRERDQAAGIYYLGGASYFIDVRLVRVELDYFSLHPQNSKN